MDIIVNEHFGKGKLFIFLLSRLIRLSDDKNKEQKRQKLISIEISLKGHPEEIWRYQYDIAEYRLFHSVWIKNNILAFFHYLKGFKAASLIKNQLGQILCLRGLGMSIDEIFCGIIPPLYLIGTSYFYKRASQIAHKINQFEEQEYALSLVYLLIARAYFQLGAFSKAKEIFSLILKKHGGSSFLKGHSLRFLSCIEAYEGKSNDFYDKLDQAFEEFAYVENKVEQIDVLRSKTKCYLITGNIDKYKLYLEKALNGYKQLNNKRGIIRTQALKFIYEIIPINLIWSKNKLFKRLILIF